MKEGNDIFETVYKEYGELLRHIRSLNTRMKDLTFESDAATILAVVMEHDALRKKIFDLQERLCGDRP